MKGTGYSEWSPPADLSAAVACIWRGRVGDPSVLYTDRVLPDGCVDVIWDGARLFVAGPDTGPVLLARSAARTFIGIRMRPGHAPGLLHCPASEVRDRRVDVAELWGVRRAAAVADQIAAAETGDAVAACGGAAAAYEGAVAALLARVVRRQLAARPSPDRLIDDLIASLRARKHASPGLIAALASDLGLTARSLHRRCTETVGYGPKTLDRILRFRRAQRMARSLPAPSLAALAAAAGYADQAHLTRECRRLAGLPPARLFASTAPVVRDGAGPP
jgi:AraC-like DNA-binding protein